MEVAGKRIRAILRLLQRVYGRPAPFRRSDPVGQLIGTILSQNTTDKNSLKAFEILKRHFRSWEGLLRTSPVRIARLIKSAGLANIKAGRIKDVLSEIKRREGRIDLSSLRGLSVEDSLKYLTSLAGVGPKTAACVLLFSFGRPVMPVDTHIFRVTKRLGLIGEGVDVPAAHEILTKMVPKRLIYESHLGIIEHGRRTCKAQNPGCGRCAVYSLCRFGKKALFTPRARMPRHARG
jgi:endonuclease-3